MKDLIDRTVLKSRMYTEAFESDTNMQRWDSGCWIRYKLFEKVVDNMPTVPYSPRWHRVEDELPPNAKHPGAFCPKVRVLTRWGVTDGWFNPDMGRNGLWCVLLWFFMGTWKEDDIDFERGDRPKMVWLSQDDVIAWMPIEPPKEEQWK